ncbi:uncharacterized protein [Typha angustifolia]|uniref:uncharacterized protein n=1 Tax=Typha angustifolia TaxID=59011 RepID=UPI003C30B811
MNGAALVLMVWFYEHVHFKEAPNPVVFPCLKRWTTSKVMHGDTARKLILSLELNMVKITLEYTPEEMHLLNRDWPKLEELESESSYSYEDCPIDTRPSTSEGQAQSKGCETQESTDTEAGTSNTKDEVLEEKVS